ncbi:lytic transglycosylase domain-containing protein [Pandoraea sputorum]|uniref:lytic transglycosylase domain-containing protein n=1 Tax=Pandoraea sputorum TaxID=93222 RepID=UPI00125A34EC|nr:lytic transglycosylase domain-containing protein [Pandoraea sputorum]VVE59108.1 lytic transglycosylase [Pandoraea sputorum]
MKAVEVNAIEAGRFAVYAGFAVFAVLAMLPMPLMLPLTARAQTGAQPQPQSMPFETLATQCAPDVHPSTLRGVVSTESSGNPYAIGVVGARLERQPRTLAEAVATARALERQGFNFSMGLGQVKRGNLARYGETYETVFDPCRNLKAGGAILKDCYARARAQMRDEQRALRAAFSCYYSGNFARGFRPDKAGQPSYVQKVVAHATDAVPPIPVVPAIEPLKPTKPPDTDGAIPVLPAAGAAAGSAKSAGAPPQWVFFADAPSHEEKATPSSTFSPSGTPDSPAVQVRRVAPDTAGMEGAEGARAANVARPEVGTAREARAAVSTKRAPANGVQKEASFVQFAN